MAKEAKRNYKSNRIFYSSEFIVVRKINFLRGKTKLDEAKIKIYMDSQLLENV